MRTLAGLMLTLCLACGLAAAPPAKKPGAVPLRIEGDTVVVVKSFPARVVAPEGADLYSWSYPAGVEAAAADNVLTITKAPRGSHRISVNSVTIEIDFEKKTRRVIKDSGEVTVNVGDAPPGPGPDPGPKPPEPKPGPVTGLRVLIVRETKDNETRAHLNVIYSTKVRDWLKKHTAEDGFRVWDKDVDVSKERPLWQELWKAARPQLGKLPAVVLVSDQRGETLPLPESEADMLALLEKWSGRSKKGKR